MNVRRLFLLAIALPLIGQGCAPSSPTVTPHPPTALPAQTDVEQQVTPPADGDAKTTPSAATYEDYSAEAYNAALAVGQPVFLNFYASWCPLCREQEPRILNLYTNGQFPNGIKGFRVHYNDDETSSEDKALAKQFNVTYQHTYIFIGTDGKEAKRTLGTTTNQAFIESLQLIAP
ncbi:redoxin domain-containing protein [Candidatus Uhrbacteria bacterium]|nr:redoxin domain-containing protein [Candidatus Uhrbacteria bacterium]